MGMSFAIPIDVALNVKEQLLKNGKVNRSRIGVSVQDMSQPLSQSFGMATPHGALVSAVEPQSPGERAGLKAGDIITSVNGRIIDHSYDLPAVISQLTPGAEARLGVWHDRKATEVSVRTVLLEDTPVQMAKASSEDGGGKLGLVLRSLKPDEQKELHTRGRLVVEDVSGPALAAGLQAGDVVLGVNGSGVATVAELKREVARAGHSVALLIQREDAQIYIPVDPGMKSAPETPPTAADRTGGIPAHHAVPKWRCSAGASATSSSSPATLTSITRVSAWPSWAGFWRIAASRSASLRSRTGMATADFTALGRTAPVLRRHRRQHGFDGEPVYRGPSGAQRRCLYAGGHGRQTPRPQRHRLFAANPGAYKRRPDRDRRHRGELCGASRISIIGPSTCGAPCCSTPRRTCWCMATLNGKSCAIAQRLRAGAAIGRHHRPARHRILRRAFPAAGWRSIPSSWNARSSRRSR